MRRCLAALSLFILAPVQAAPASLEELIARHTEAIGGREAVERVKAVQFELTIVEPQFKVEGVYRADRQQRMRIDIYAAGKRVFTEAYDGRGAWQMGADGAKQNVSAMGAAALRNGVLLPGKLFGLHEQQSIGNRLELLGRERVDDIHYHVIGVTTATSDHIRLYINPSTWLIERTRIRKALHPDVDPTVKWLKTRFSDFSRYGGRAASLPECGSRSRIGRGGSVHNGEGGHHQSAVGTGPIHCRASNRRTYKYRSWILRTSADATRISPAA